MHKQNNKSISVLIPDGECHHAIHVVNCLGQLKFIKIHLMSNKKYNAIRFSRYIDSYSFYEESSPKGWINNINLELNRIDVDVVMPIFDESIRTLAKYKNLFKDKSRLGLLPKLSDYDISINKGFLSKHLENNRLPHPKSIIINSGESTDQRRISIPALIKPLYGFAGGQGIKVFESKNELDYFFKNNMFEFPYLVQQYIEGYDIDCSVLCREGKILAYTIQKGNLLGKNKFTPQIGLDFVHEEDLYLVIEQLMKSLNWTGVAHIDMRYDKNDRQFKVIEINPRYWVSLDASLIAGINFPYLYILASLGEDFELPSYRNTSYLSLKGLLKKIKLDKKFIFNVTFILNNTQLKFALLDPLPMIYKYLYRTKNILKNKIKNSI